MKLVLYRKKKKNKFKKLYQMVKKNACVFISGYGSNLKCLISSSRDNNFPINISLVICDNIKS